VRAFPVSPGRWLRVEGKLLTEVPWFFAAPTGANKVTVYWDGVPGATGYRVRWRKSNENDYPPGNVVVVGADVRQQSVARLEREQEYYFVVEAAYNGLWGPPSEEDSAVPHEGAIPWDTQDPNQIIPAARDAFGAFYGDNGTTRDTPHVYFGIAYRVSQRRAVDIEGGISFHPAGRGGGSKLSIDLRRR
jgi:hypothetical protein